MIQIQHSLPGTKSALPIRKSLILGAGKHQSTHGIRSQVSQAPFDRAEMIESLQERRDVQTHDAAHQGGNGQDYRGEVDGEARVRDEGVEDDADAFAAVDNGEAVEGYDEEELGRAGEAGSKVAEHGEQEASEDFKGELSDGVL